MKIIHFYQFDSDPRFTPFLLYVRCKSGVTFVRRCFRDAFKTCHDIVSVLERNCLHMVLTVDDFLKSLMNNLSVSLYTCQTTLF